MRRKETSSGESFFRVKACEVKSASPPVCGYERRKKMVRPGVVIRTSESQTVDVMLSLISKLKL